MRGLAKRRDERWQSASEFLDALNQAMPEALGVNSERRTADFLQVLLKDRIAERRETLRTAEALAEESGPRECIVSASLSRWSFAIRAKRARWLRTPTENDGSQRAACRSCDHTRCAEASAAMARPRARSACGRRGDGRSRHHGSSGARRERDHARFAGPGRGDRERRRTNDDGFKGRGRGARIQAFPRPRSYGSHCETRPRRRERQPTPDGIGHATPVWPTHTSGLTRRQGARCSTVAGRAQSSEPRVLGTPGPVGGSPSPSPNDLISANSASPAPTRRDRASHCRTAVPYRAAPPFRSQRRLRSQSALACCRRVLRTLCWRSIRTPTRIASD